jgi:hypothetical protein
MYVDTVAENSGTGFTGNTTVASAIEFGKAGAGYYHTGHMDDVRLYNRGLSANEVAAIYNQTRDGGYGDLAIQPTRFHHLPVAAAVVSKPRMTLLGVG